MPPLLYELLLGLLLCLQQCRQKLIQSLRLLECSHNGDQHTVFLWETGQE